MDRNSAEYKAVASFLEHHKDVHKAAQNAMAKKQRDVFGWDSNQLNEETQKCLQFLDTAAVHRRNGAAGERARFLGRAAECLGKLWGMPSLNTSRECIKRNGEASEACIEPHFAAVKEAFSTAQQGPAKLPAELQRFSGEMQTAHAQLMNSGATQKEIDASRVTLFASRLCADKLKGLQACAASNGGSAKKCHSEGSILMDCVFESEFHIQSSILPSRKN